MDEENAHIIKDSNLSTFSASEVAIIPVYPSVTDAPPHLGSIIAVGGILYLGTGTAWVSGGGGSGSVTSISAGLGLTTLVPPLAPGPPITSTGTISLQYNTIGFGTSTTIIPSATPISLGGSVTFDIVAGSIGPTQLEPTGVIPGTYGDPAGIPSFTVDADGRITAASTGGSSVSSVMTNLVSTNADFYPTFVPLAASAVQSIDVGSGITFNPSTNILTTLGAIKTPLLTLNSGANQINIKPDPALAVSYNYNYPAAAPLSSVDCQVIATSGVTNIFYSIHPQNEVFVRLNPGPGEFSSVAAALLSIPLVGPDAPSLTNQYAVRVTPGTYTEPLNITVFSFVYIYGDEMEAVTFVPAAFGAPFFNFQINSGMNFCGISNTDPAFPAVVFNNCGNFCLMHKVTFTNCPKCISVTTDGAATDYSQVFLEYVDMTDATTYSLEITDSNTAGGFGSITSIENYFTFGHCDNAIIVNGKNSQLTCHATDLQGDGTGVGVLAENGSATNVMLNIRSLGITNFTNGILVPNDGSVQNIASTGVIFTGCTLNLNVLNSLATGFLNSYSEFTKAIIPTSAPFFITGQNPFIITVGTKGSNFTSVTAALAWITDNSPLKRYTIFVEPGVYVCTQIVMKPYVSLVGRFQTSVILAAHPSVAGFPFIKGNIYAAVSTLSLSVVSYLASPSYMIEYLGDPSGSHFRCDNVGFDTAGSLMHIGSTNGPAIFLSFNSLINQTSPFTNGLYIEDSGPSNNPIQFFIDNIVWGPNSAGLANFANFATIKSFKSPAATPNIFGVLTNSSCGHILIPSVGTGIILEGKIYATIETCILGGFVTALQINNSVEITTILCTATTFSSNTIDINVQSAITTGAINGTASVSKIIVAAGSKIGIVVDDPNGSVGFGGSIYQGKDWNHVTQISDQIQNASTIGSIDILPVLTSIGGLNISVTGGNGYVFLGPAGNNYLWNVTWMSVASMALPDNSLSWVYANGSGSVLSSTSQPDFITNVILGTVQTYLGNVTYVQQIGPVINNLATQINNMLSSVVGPIVQSGCIATPGSSLVLRAVQVTSGVYYVGAPGYFPTSNDNITMIGFYGGTNEITLNEVPLQWDNAGVLTAITPGNYVKHTIFVLSNPSTGTQYFLVYAQQEYPTLLTAQLGNVPIKPSTFLGNMCIIAGVIVTDTDPSSPLPADRFIDLRPSVGSSSGGVSGTSDHNSLSNLTVGNAHPQYLRVDGTENMTGNLNVANNNVIGSGLPTSCTGSIGPASNIMTITVVASGTLAINQIVFGTGVAYGTTIVNQLTGPIGGIGTYTVNGAPQTVGSTSLSTFGGNTWNTVDPSFHGFRHLPGGEDELATAAPVSIGSTNAIGSSSSLSRADHVHQGVLSVNSNAGAANFGALTLVNGTNVTITNAPSGTFTFNVATGAGGVTTFSAGTTGFTPSSPTSGAITLAGILNSVNGGTGINNGVFTLTLGGTLSTGGALAITGTAALNQILVGTGAGTASWQTATGAVVTSFQTSLSGLTPSVATTGAITLAGTLGGASGGTGINNGAFTLTLGGTLSTGGALAITGTAATGQILIGTGAGTASWQSTSGTIVTSFSAGTTGFTPNSATTGAITLAGTLGGSNGGTGVNNGSFTLTLGGTLSTGGALAITGTAALNQILVGTGAGTASWQSSSGAIVTSFQTSLSGLTPSVATTGAITLAGTLGGSSGGTGVNNGAFTLTLGGTLSTGGALAITGTAALNQLLIGTGAGTASWQTATGTVVTSFSAGTTGFTPNVATTGAITLAGTLVPGNGGTGITTTPTNGQLLIGNTGTGAYTVATLGTGTGISTSIGAGSLQINNTGVLSVRANAGAAEIGALTLANGTNVTIVDSPAGTFTFNVATGAGGVTTFSAGTTGFTPNSATAGAITLAGILNSANGGTGINNGSFTLTLGGTLSTGGALAITGTAALNQILIGTGAGTASWQSSTGTVVTSFSAGTTGFTPNSATTGAITLAGTLVPGNGGTGITTTPTNGQLLIGNTGTGAYTVATLGTGTGISTSIGAGSLQINNTGVTSNVAGTGISVSGATGAVTISNLGVLSIAANAGAAETGALILANGTNVTIVDSPAGTFTFNVATGAGGVTTFSAGTTGFTPSSPTAGTITLAGILNSTNGGTGVNNGAFTLTLGGTLSTGGALAITGTAAAGQILVGTGAGTASWQAGGAVSSFSAGTTGLTPSSPTAGAIVLAGTLAVANGGTGVTSSTGTVAVVLQNSPTLTGTVILPGSGTWGPSFVGLGNSSPTAQLTVGAANLNASGSATYLFGYPFASTDTTIRRVGTLAQSNEGTNPFVLGMSMQGNATPASRTALLQTAVENSAFTGVLALQPQGGSCTVSTYGTFTSTGQLQLTTTSSQIRLGAVSTAITLNANIAGAARTYTMADAGGNANFVLDTGGALTITNVSATGQILTATGTTTATWQALSASGVSSITGTANQITASASTGAVTLSTPSTFIGPGTIQDTSGMLYSTNAAVSAAGSTQGTATALTKSFNVVTTVASNTGVALPTPGAAGYIITIINKGANTLNIYPASGGTIDSASLNAAVTLLVGSIATFQASTTTQWRTVDPSLVASGTGVSVTYGNGQTTIAVSSTSAATVSTVMARDASANTAINNLFTGYTTTATAAGTTTITVSSTRTQYFTGVTTQTLVLPVASTLVLGVQYIVVNNSTGNVTVQSSGANNIIIMPGSTTCTFTCILASGTTAASWDFVFSLPKDPVFMGTGTNSANSGTGSVTLGKNSTTVSGSSAVAIGDTATSSAASSVAIGTTAQATGVNNVAIGGNSLATGATGAICIGNNSSATGVTSLTIGSFTALAAGDNSIAIGPTATCAVAATSSVAIGQNSTCSVGINSCVYGLSATANNTQGTAIGAFSTTNGIFNGTAIGVSATCIDAAHAMAFGCNTSSVLPGSFGISVNNAAFQLPLYTSLYATTATAAGTTTLTVTSAQAQYFTGATTQTVVLPVASTLALGFKFEIVNRSSGTVTVQSSGGNTVKAVLTLTWGYAVCILTSGTTAASWSFNSGGAVV